jgi:ubiquitin-protein ligase
LSFRLLRLQSDYEAVKRLAHLHPKIEVEGVSGNPPERYVILMKVRSLREQAEKVVLVREHRVEITLPKTYPRDAPVCRMLTPVFHPNIAPHTICIGDHWSAAERLDSMIQRIGEMLAFQSYNVKSPLNGQAARWVEEHLTRLPIEREEFFLDLADAERREAKTGQCTNCGAARPPLAPCGQGHFLCADCVERCPKCGAVLCLSCGASTCARCTQAAAAPAHTGWVCANCGNRDTKARQCRGGHILCSDCIVRCEKCGRGLCMLCGQVPCPACARAG